MCIRDSVTISWADRTNIHPLLPLLAALYKHDNPSAKAPTIQTIEEHCRLLLEPTTPHRLAIAWRNGEAVGLAAIGIFISISDPRPDHWKQIELKELFVLEERRGIGIGTLLMDWVVEEAKAKGGYRIDWHVRRDNHRGIKFYEGFKGKVVESRLSMRKVLL